MIEREEQKTAVTVAEAARRLYLAPDLVVSLLERGLLEGYRGDEGDWRVLLPIPRSAYDRNGGDGVSPGRASRFVPEPPSPEPSASHASAAEPHSSPGAASNCRSDERDALARHLTEHQQALAERERQVTRLVDTFCDVMVKLVDRALPADGGTTRTGHDRSTEQQDVLSKRLESVEDRLARHDRDMRDLSELFELLRQHLEGKTRRED